jgi:cytochrome c-type biogenesis protein CcmH/NrfG
MLEYLVVGLLVIALINTGFLYKIGIDLRALLEVTKKWGTPSQAETDLKNGENDAVIARGLKDVAENPQHAKAHWYLGQAYYQKQMWKEAKEQMEIVAQLQPCWRSESTDPYIEEIGRRLKAVSDSQS